MNATGRGPTPQQFVPYYLNGMLPLSFQVADSNLVFLRDHYVSHILAAQHFNTSNTQSGSGGDSFAAGWLGPVIDDTDPEEYWSKYDAVLALESYAEAVATDDPAAAARVIVALVAHQRQFYVQLRAQAPVLNASRWGFAR